MRGVLAAAIALVAVFLLVIAGCGDNGGPSAGPSSSPCDAGRPPLDPRVQADYCGVSAIEITRNSVLPLAPRVGKVTIDLYIDDPNHTGTTCGVSVPIDALCGVNDARDYVSQDSADPHGDPSRTRVEGVFDFATGNIVFRVNPSCTVKNGSSPDKVCHAPKREGDGNNVDVSQLGSGGVRVDTTFTQSDYGIPAGLCAIKNYFVIRPDEASGDFYLTGQGAGFPSIAIIHGGRVVIADQGVHSTSLCGPTRRDYSHSPPALSGSDFASKANAVCKAANDQIQALAAPTVASDYVVLADEFMRLATQSLKQLQALTPPASDQTAYSQFLGYIRQEIPRLGDLKAAAGRGDDQQVAAIVEDVNNTITQPLDQVASGLGLDECAKDAQPQG